MLSPQLIAQRTVTNKGYGGKIIEQYNVNANGDMHGTYKTWNRQGRLIKNYNYQNGELHGNCLLYFDNGTLQEESTYYKGTMTSLKVYQYNENGTKRRLTRNATWDRSGNVLTDGDNAGKLANGRWRFNYPRYGDYSETYNGNDTLYVWDDRAKQRFLGRYLDGIRVYTKEEAMLMKEQALQDSISYAMELEEEERLYLIEEAKEQAMKDSIEQVKTNYNKLAKSIIKTNTSYTDLLTNGKYCIEYEFFSFLCKYIKKKKDTDSILSNMIMDILEISSVKDLDIKAVLSESNITGFQTTYTNEGITITNKQDKTKITALKPYYNANFHFTTQSNWNLTYTVPEDILANYSKQRELLDIILYCKEHNIAIK